MAANMNKVPCETKDCYICRDTYENPKLLPCIHAFCQKCLQDIGTKTGKNAGDTMPCPICEQLFSIPDDGFDGLPTDFFLSRLMKATPEDRRCAACLERMKENTETDVPVAAASCMECQLLDSTQTAICTGSECDGFNIIGSIPGDTDDHAVPRILEARACDLHPQLKLTFYCTDCEKVLCDLCFDEYHQKHRLQSTKKAAASFCDEFQNNRLSSSKTKTLQRMEEFKQGKLELGGIAKCLRDNVLKRRENIEELLEKHDQALLQDIEIEEQRLVVEYESISNKHERHLTCLESFEIYCRDIMTRGSPDDVCSAMTKLKRRSDELVEMHGSVNSVRTPQYSLQFRESDLEEFFSSDGFNIIGSIPVAGRQRPTKESRKEQIARLNERILDLRKELKQMEKENRNCQAEVEKLKEDLQLHQSLIDAQEGPDPQTGILVYEREEGSRMEIESLQQQLEEMTDAKQSKEWQMGDERTRHKELNERLNRRVEELEAQQMRSIEELSTQRMRSDMEIGHLSNEISVIKKLIPGSNRRERRRYQVDREFSGQIMNEKSATADIRITGLAVLGGELFITKCDSNVLYIRDLNNIWTLRRRVTVKGLHDPYDISPCPKNLCLYIIDKNSRKIFNIDKAGNITAAWTTGESVGTLSVAEDSNVILILHEDNKLKEYDSYGGFIKDIDLFKFGIDSPWHALKLNRCHYVISHGDYRHRLQRVCIADVVEGATIRSFGEDLDWQMRREIMPNYLVRDAEGYIMVADRKNNSVLLLKPSLEFDKVVVENEDCGNRPEEQLLAERFCLDEAGSLIVASNFKENGRWAGSVYFYQFD